MDFVSCPDCFKDQRSINDIFQQAIIDAQKLANEQQKKVAVIQEGYNFIPQVFTGSIPNGCRKVVEPGK